VRRFYLWFSVAALLALVVWQVWPDRVIEHEAGVLCPDEPRQTKSTRRSPWLHGDFMITALADYDIRARVLSRREYGSGKESDLSPVDLALGWGPMSDQFVLDKLEISQGHRWYKWKVKDLMPIPQKDIERSSANVHIVPANSVVEDALDDVYVGSIVHMTGYLIKATQEGTWRWVSSTTRNDTGDGACEVFWVETMKVENK
jgi:hypothetical protein